MSCLRQGEQRIADEAIAWFLQFQDATGAKPNVQAFSEWLLRSPAHVQEYLRVSLAWQALSVVNQGGLDTDALVAAARRHCETDNVVDLPTRLARRVMQSKRAPRRFFLKGRWMAVAAALMLVVGLGVGYVTWQSAATFETAVGEQHRITLQDGSVLFLNTNSEVRVRWPTGERRIELIRGEARFNVAKDRTRPFIVTTAKAAVRALGTVFNVRADAQSTEVAVFEGEVEVSRVLRRSDVNAKVASAAPSPLDASSLRLAAGQRATVTTLGMERDAGRPMEAAAAWTEGRLAFRDQPLSAVVSELNRYRRQPLVIDDPGLAGLKISGVFDLANPESLFAYLGAYEAVRIDRRSDGSEHLYRSADAAHRAP
jgi:transmembrane sensor